MQTIDRAHPVAISIGDQSEHRTTWGEFLADNADGIDATEATRIERDLLKRPGCTAFGGGGASAGWTIRLIVGFEGEGGGMSPPRTRYEANHIDEEADDDTLFP